MWALLPRKTQVLIIAGLAIILAWGMEAAGELLTGQSTSEVKYISLVVMLISGVVFPIASRVWRRLWRRFPSVARKTFPDLNGTWKGELVSTWADPVAQQAKPLIPATIWIRQGLFSTSIKLCTRESTSYSTRCLLEADHDAGRFRLWYSYDNNPKAEYRYRSARHEGVA